MKRGLAIVVLFLVAAALAVYSFVLCAFLVAAVCVILAFKYTSPAWLKVVLCFASALLVAGVWQAGKTPAHVNDRSSVESRLPWVGPVVSAVPEAYRVANDTPQPDPLQQAREELRAKIQQLRKQSNVVRRALAAKDAADVVVEYGEKHQPRLDTKPIGDARDGIDKAVRELGLDSANYKRFQDKTEEMLQSAERAMREATDAKTIENLLDDLRLDAVTKSAGSVESQLRSLDLAVANFERNDVDADLTRSFSHALTFDETHDRLIREEWVGIASRGALLRQLDASDLMSDVDATNPATLRVVYGPNPSLQNANEVVDAARIAIPRGITQVTLVKRVVVPAGVQELPSALRLARFRYFTFTWPVPLPTRIRATVDLQDRGGPGAAPYSFEVPVNSPIAQVRVPADALFASSYALGAPQREGREDVFRPVDLSPSYFQTHESVWVELMPDHVAFRNSLVQGHRELLFPENLLASGIAAGIGAAIALFFV